MKIYNEYALSLSEYWIRGYHFGWWLNAMMVLYKCKSQWLKISPFNIILDRLYNISSFIKHDFWHYFLQSFMHAQCIVQTRLKFIFWKLLTYNFVYILTKCYTKQNKMLHKKIWPQTMHHDTKMCEFKKKPIHNGECLQAFSFNHGGGEDSLSKPSSSYYRHDDDGSI